MQATGVKQDFLGNGKTQTQAARYRCLRVKVGEFPLWLSELRTQLAPMRMQVQSLALLSGLWIWHCYKLWCRLQMGLWCRLAAAALIRRLACELPYALGVALKRKKEPKWAILLKKKKKKQGLKLTNWERREMKSFCLWECLGFSYWT